jgi:chromosome segregation ATPase
MATGDIALLVVAACQVLGLLLLLVLAMRLPTQLSELGRQVGNRGDSLQAELRTTSQSARQALLQLELLASELRNSGLVARAAAVLDSAQAAAGRFDPLAAEMTHTLGDARELMDDATQTSQSVRSLADDLSATNKELAVLSATLADIAANLKDQDLAAKLTNVLADTSVLAADIGILAENANSYLETGKPLVDGIKALGRARRSASQLGSSATAVQEGIRGSQHR